MTLPLSVRANACVGCPAVASVLSTKRPFGAMSIILNEGARAQKRVFLFLLRLNSETRDPPASLYLLLVGFPVLK